MHISKAMEHTRMLSSKWWVIDSNDAVAVRMFHQPLSKRDFVNRVSWVTGDRQCQLLLTDLCDSFWPSASGVPWNVPQLRLGSVNRPSGTRPSSTRQKPGTNSNIGEIILQIQVSQICTRLIFTNREATRSWLQGRQDSYFFALVASFWSVRDYWWIFWNF